MQDPVSKVPSDFAFDIKFDSEEAVSEKSPAPLEAKAPPRTIPPGPAIIPPARPPAAPAKVLPPLTANLEASPPEDPADSAAGTGAFFEPPPNALPTATREPSPAPAANALPTPVPIPSAPKSFLIKTDIEGILINATNVNQNCE